jgi:PleD family two-component response regulator
MIIGRHMRAYWNTHDDLLYKAKEGGKDQIRV